MSVATPSGDDLAQRAASGLGWRMLSSIVGFASNFVIGVVLARLLPPSDFGLLGLALIVVGFGNLFVSLGMGPALIQRAELSERHVRVAFTLSIVFGSVVGALTYAAAPLAAQLLRDASVTPILRVLALSFAFAGFGIVSQSLLVRALAFKKLFVIELVSTLASGALGIACALYGLGVWSLVYSTLLKKVLTASMAYALTEHAVRPLLARTEVRQLTGFGVGVSLSQTFNYIAVQGDYFIVGRVLGPAALGFYTRAYTLMTIPTTNFVQALGSVLFPVASRMQAQPARLREAYRVALGAMSLVTIPVLVLLVLLAPELIRGIYGPKWERSIVPLQILAAFGTFRALYNGAANFVRAKGWVYRIMSCQLLYGACVVVGAWLAASSHGIVGVAWAVGIAILCMWIAMSSLANKATSTSLRSFLGTLTPGLWIGAAAGSSCAFVKWALTGTEAGPLVVLCTASAAGAAAALAGVMLLPQSLLDHLPHRLLTHLQRAVPQRAQRLFSPLLLHLSAKPRSPIHPSVSET